MPPSPTRHRVALAIALVGVAVSIYTQVVHGRLEHDAGYTSFCNLGGVVNCDAVLASRYGTFLDVPVSVWAVVAFVGGALLAVPGAFLGITGGLADLLLLGAASASLGFALVLAGIATFVLRHACLLCLTMDAVIIAWFVTVAPLAWRFEVSPRVAWWRRRATAHAAAATGLVLAVAGGTLAAARTPGAVTSLAEVQARDAKFYDLYTKLPVRPEAERIPGDGHSRGRPDAPVTIVEFSDFQCPACAQAFTDLHELLRSRPDVRLVFRHFPLDSSCNKEMPHALHPNACLAAVAAECAGRQGRFWEYHDVLFQNQGHLSRDDLFRYARDLGLAIPDFRTCLDDPATRDRVVADVDAGVRVGVESTPTLFINGRTVQGALERPYYDYALIIEKAQRDAHASEGGS